jgi:hypothetical protein
LEDSAIMSSSSLSVRRLAATRPRFLTLSGLAVPAFGLLLGGLVAGVPSPAAAQFFSPYYDDAPGYYGPPRGRYRAPAPASDFSPNDVRPMLRSMGFVSINPARVAGNAYVTEATDGDGVRLRVRIDRYSGDIISMRPIGNERAERTPLPPAPVRNPPKKPPAPKTAALPPAAPLPPSPGGNEGAASPDITAPPGATAPGSWPSPSTEVTPETKPAEIKPAEAKPSEAKPSEAKPSEAKPSEAKPSEAKPVEAKPAAPPAKETAAKPETPKSETQKSEAAKSETPVRVIPGVAVPTPEAPPVVADAKKGTGAGTATPAGSVSAGTASVLSRDATKKPAEAKPKTLSN